MQEPSLEEFDLSKELIERAGHSRNEEERISRFLCGGWIFAWIILGLAVGIENASEDFGFMHWMALGIIIGVFSVGPFAACVMPQLMARFFPFFRFYSPIFSRYSKFQTAQKEHNNWKEHERIRLWTEEEELKKRKAEYWFGLGGHSFEHELARLLRKLGWQATVTSGSNDKGIDIFLVRDGLRSGVQCKAHRNPVGPSIVRELLGSCLAAKCDRAILVALGGITTGARDFAIQHSVEIWTINDVLKMQSTADNNLLLENTWKEIENGDPF